MTGFHRRGGAAEGVEAIGRGVRHESRGKEDDKHIKHALLGMFNVFVVKGGG